MTYVEPGQIEPGPPVKILELFSKRMVIYE